MLGVEYAPFGLFGALGDEYFLVFVTLVVAEDVFVGDVGLFYSFK